MTWSMEKTVEAARKAALAFINFYICIIRPDFYILPVMFQMPG